MPSPMNADLRHPLREVFERYHASWEARSPERIAALHSPDTVFQLHDGSALVHGRAALQQQCAAMFAKFDFALEPLRLFYGDGHWTFEWCMAIALRDAEGSPFTATVEMLDLVTVDARHEVTRKDVYMNGAQAMAAFSRAGIATDGGIRY